MEEQMKELMKEQLALVSEHILVHEIYTCTTMLLLYAKYKSTV